MKEISDEGKIDVLLNLLDSQHEQIQVSEEREATIFQWTTNLLLVSFGALVALSNRSVPLPHSTMVKLLASILVGMPATFSVAWMIWRVRRSARHAAAIDRIRELLHLFEDGYYGENGSVFPPFWKGAFAKYIVSRRETWYYITVVILMTACVVITLWLVL